MQFLRTLFWMVVAVIAAALSFNNWTPVHVLLWTPVELVIKLPVLVGIAFLAGLLPGVILHRTSRWRLRRRLDSAERALAEQAIATAPEVAASPAAPIVRPGDPIG